MNPSSKISLVLYDISYNPLLIPTPVSSILTSFIFTTSRNITLMPRVLQGRFPISCIKGFIPSTLCHISFALVTKKHWDFLWNCRSFMRLYFIHAFCTVRNYLVIEGISACVPRLSLKTFPYSLAPVYPNPLCIAKIPSYWWYNFVSISVLVHTKIL